MKKMPDPDLENSDLSSSLFHPAEEKLPGGGDGGERVCIDEMLRRYSGEFGPWQLSHFLLTSLAWALNAFHTMVVVFADRHPAWRCTAAASAAAPAGSACPMDLCGFEPGSWEWTGGSTASSTVAEWGLVCRDRYKIGLAQSVFFAGSMIGAGVFGHLSDSSLGRKGSLTVACAVNAVSGCLTALSPDYGAYAAVRFVTGLGTGGVGLCAFVLATEPVGPTKRGVVGMSAFYLFSGGCVVLSAAAYFCRRSWRALYVVASLPSLLFLVAVLPFVSESPRWYLVRRKPARAMDVMRKIAESNGRRLPAGISLMMDCEDSDPAATTEEATSGSVVDVVSSPVTRARLVLTVAVNFLSSVVYYGLSLNVVNLKTDLYAGVVLNAVGEMPGYVLTALLLKWYGRKPLLIGTMWLSGAFCAVGILLPAAAAGGGMWEVMRTGCGVMGIFAMAATFNLLFVYAAELFPTAVRSAALGCVTQAGQAGAILAPLVVVLGGGGGGVGGEEGGGGLPFAVFGACGFAGGLMAFYLPETLNRPLYDTMAGMKAAEEEQEENGRGGG